jgi:hypothetical protein
MRGALSEGWRAEGERHRCDQNQSRTFHVVPPVFGLEGTEQASLPALTERFLLDF